MNYEEFVRDRYLRGMIIPRWKGFVAFDYMRNETIVAPIFFNILFHWLFAIFEFVAGYPVQFDKFKQTQRELRSKTANDNYKWGLGSAIRSLVLMIKHRLKI